MSTLISNLRFLMFATALALSATPETRAESSPPLPGKSSAASPARDAATPRRAVLPSDAAVGDSPEDAPLSSKLDGRRGEPGAMVVEGKAQAGFMHAETFRGSVAAPPTVRRSALISLLSIATLQTAFVRLQI